MQYQKNKSNFTNGRPKFVKKTSNRPLGFHGYYVEVRDGEDPMRAYRKMKKWIKEDKFVETVKEKGTYRKPSEIKRHKKNLAKLRTKYAVEKEKAEKNY